MVKLHRDPALGLQNTVPFLIFSSGKLFIFFIVFYFLCAVGCLMVSGIRDSKNMVMPCKSDGDKQEASFWSLLAPK